MSFGEFSNDFHRLGMRRRCGGGKRQQDFKLDRVVGDNLMQFLNERLWILSGKQSNIELRGRERRDNIHLVGTFDAGDGDRVTHARAITWLLEEFSLKRRILQRFA